MAVKKNKSKSLRSSSWSCLNEEGTAVDPARCKECKAECRDRKSGASTSDAGKKENQETEVSK